MPTGLPEDLKRSIWERDGYRCRECRAAVATDGGRCPQIHHIVPRSQDGTDDPGNLMTLCFPCHATKGLRRHAELLRTAAPDRLPEFVKQMTWDFGLNLLAYSEWIDPLRFDPAPVLEGFAVWQRYLETIAGLARDAQAGGPTADVESWSSWRYPLRSK